MARWRTCGRSGRCRAGNRASVPSSRSGQGAKWTALRASRAAWGVAPLPHGAGMGSALLLRLAGVPRRRPACWRRVRSARHVVCGVSDGPKGYSSVTGKGVWSGISVDFCRALAAAVLGSHDAVKFRLVPPSERFAALQSGEIDVLSRNVAITSSLDTTLGIRFPGVLVYDGQGFLVRKSQDVASALELSGARVCVTTETADAQGVADYFGALKMPYDLSKFDKWPDAATAYTNKSCQVLSADVSVLARPASSRRSGRAHHPAGACQQAAGRPRGAPGRRGLVQRRALDHLCADRRRGARHQQRQRRRHEDVGQRGAPLPRPRPGPRQAPRPQRRLDAARRSSRSATTASCSSATSASSRPSSSSAGRTTSPPRRPALRAVLPLTATAARTFRPPAERRSARLP